MHLEDNFDSIDWARLPKYIKPVAEPRQRKSWIYLYGFRVALLKDPNRIYFVCRYCHERKFIDAGRGGIFETTRAVSAAARHLMEQRPGHSHRAPGKSAVAMQESLLHQVLKVSTTSVSQAVANELISFSTHRFRLAAVGWLVESNHPLSEFKTPAFRQLLAAANPEAEKALWTSHMSVSRYVVRLYDYLKPLVIKELSQALSKIHLSFDGWTTKSGKRGFLGIVAHYVSS